MKGRTPTAEEKRHMQWLVKTFGCWCCAQMGIENREEDVLIHHVDGKTKPGAHKKTIPLCDPHHSRYKETGFHYNPTAWEMIWGTQEEILEQIEHVKAGDSDTDQDADLEPVVGDESMGEEEDQRPDPPYHLHVHSIRSRLADIDGISAKAAIDGLVKAGILAEDNDNIIKSITHTQERGQDEKTIITITAA